MDLFFCISAQTKVAQADGKGNPEQAESIASLALTMSTGFGLVLISLLLPSWNWLAELLGASGAVQVEAVNYMRIRLYGEPVVLLILVTFGVLRSL